MENTMILYQKLWNFDFIWEKKIWFYSEIYI